MNPTKPGVDASELHRLFMVWYDQDRPPTVRQNAVRGCMALLDPFLHPPARLARVLGPERVEELRQEVCARLFDPESRRLARVDPAATIGYVRKALKNAALDALLKLRRSREDLIGDEALDRARHVRADAEALGNPTCEGEFAEFTAKMSEIDVEDRVGLLLTLSPDRIPNADWNAVIRGREPPPARPHVPLDYEGASRILWPPAEPEGQVARRKRLDRFRTRLRRAVASLTGETPPESEGDRG